MLSTATSIWFMIINTKVSNKKLTMAEISGIGVGVPGPVTEDGVVHQCPNLGWGTFSVAEKFQELTGVENIKIGNDANVATLGEMWRGGGKGPSS